MLIPINKIRAGDSLSILYPSVEGQSTNATLLSINNKTLYKNIDIEVELEFCDVYNENEQTFEIITRAINKYDKRFSTDEYYSMGYKNGSFYFTKYSYFLENGKSLLYSVLYNLGDLEQIRYFLNFTEEQKEELFIDDKLKYNTKYIFNFTIIDNFISLNIKRRSPVVSQGASYEWVSIINNLDIGDSNIKSIRNSELDKVISVPVQANNIDNKGFFGINIPNSHVKMYRFQIKPLDDASSINLYDDKEYSRNIATQFNFVFKNTERILMNSVNGPDEGDSNVIELHNTDKVLLDKRNISSITKEDIDIIQFNNYDLNNSQYVNKFINITNPLSTDFTGSSIYSYIGEEKSLYGQYETYMKPSSINNTNSFEFTDIEFSQIKNLPNVIISDVLVELPSTIVYDESESFNHNEVGIKEEDKLNFITKDEVIQKFGGKRFFLECNFRGTSKIFELGYIEKGKTTFDIDKEFLKVSLTYDAIWKYNVSYWIDTLASSSIYSGSTISNSTLNGYSLLKYDADIVSYIDSLLSEAYDINHTLYPDIEIYFPGIKSYSKSNDIFVSEIEDIARSLIYFNQGDPKYKSIVLDVITQNTQFNSSFINLKDEVPFTNDSAYHSQFQSFRNSWLSQAEQFRQLSLEGRKYYVSLSEDDYTLDMVNNRLDITTNEQYNDKSVQFRFWSDNSILLTPTYDSLVNYYDVDENIKNLYVDSNESIGPNELYGVLSSDKITTIQNGSIVYAIVPNLFLGQNNDRKLFADVELFSPFPESTEKVKRKVKASLVNVQELLDFDFESTRTGSEFISGATIESSNNRLLDTVDRSLEEYYAGGYNRYFPNPTGELSTVETYDISGNNVARLTNGDLVINKKMLTEYLEEKNIALTEEQWIYSEIERLGFWTSINSELLYPYALSEKFIYDVLDIGEWFNVNDTKLGNYYREVLSNIIETKNKNKIIGERAFGDDPFELNNWLDGFYTGERTLIGTGGASLTTPWGTQNSRYDMFDQLRNSLRIDSESKFSNYSLFFVDMSNIVTDNNLGFGSNYIDSTVYPVGINEEFVNNPFVDTVALSGYAYNGSYDMSELVIEESGNVISDETDFSFIPISTEFKEENKDSYTKLSNLSFEIQDILFEIKNNEDIFWGYNDSLLLKDLPSGINVNVEFEYNKKGYDTPIYSKVNLGVTNGLGEDLFAYPNKNYIADATNVRIQRIWLDNYNVSDYNLENVDDNTIQVVFNEVVFNNKPDISIKYRTDKLADTKYSNIFLDNFNDKREIKWTILTKDKFGFSRIPNNYVGFIKDSVNGTSVFRKGDMTRKDGGYSITTGGTTTGRVKVKGLTIGKENENIIAVSNIERKNNFEVKTTILFDNDIERGLMKTSFIFRGKFNLIDDAQYLSDYYEVVLNLDDNNVVLLQKYYEDDEIKTNILASISDSTNVIKRGVEYNITFSCVKDLFKVYLNKNNEKKQFLFEYDLLNGPSNESLMDNVSELQGSLGVSFYKPKNFNSMGKKIGMTTVTDKVYFSNVKITTFVPNNLTFGDTFISNSLDSEVMRLKSTYNVKGNVRRIGKTDDNITVILIGRSLFAKRGDISGWTKLGRDAKDFRIQGVYIYVNELLSNKNTILNVYSGIFELRETILTETDSLIGQIRNESKVVNKIKSFGNNILLDITNEHTYDDIIWTDEDKVAWEDDHKLWDTFEI
jgi:hypothetical protein